MKKKSLILTLASCCLLLFPAYSQSGSNQTLTVIKIAVPLRLDPQQNNGRISADGSIYTVDDKENSIVFQGRINDNWFENAKLLNVPHQGKWILAIEDGKILYIAPDEAKMMFEFKVGEKDYQLGLWVGSKIVVKKTASGNYTLLPEETIKLSPPPAKE